MAVLGNDEKSELVFNFLPKSCWVCKTWIGVVLLDGDLWNNPPNSLSNGPGNEKAITFWTCDIIILTAVVDKIKSPAKIINFILIFNIFIENIIFFNLSIKDDMLNNNNK